MIKADIVDLVVDLAKIPRAKAATAVETVIESMRSALGAGDRIELRGFGVFQVKRRKRGIGRNPKTGVEVTIPPAFVAFLQVMVAMVHDWRTRGRPHPVYVYGGIALIAVKLLNWPISATPLWHSFAGGILAMAQ